MATTISKAVIDKAVYEQEFDVVIFDEASMSYVPQIVAGADMAKKHFICMGDFNQLPPIVMSDEAEYLSVDIFKHAGITDAVKQKYGHDWLCMLDTQYRMHPSIANIASASMYYGLLKTGKGIKEEREPLLDSIPEINEAYGLADLSNMMSTCIPLQDHSKANILSAFISFALASRAGQSYDTGIITPYSYQAKLLQNMAKDYAENVQDTDPTTANIPCATVHQFQGSEKDVIIYDAVDCYRLPYPGVLLTNLKDNLANRLFNVALTRARGKFVVVANSLFMRSKGITDNLVFGKTISLSKPNSEINGKVISSLDLEHDCFQFVDKEASLPLFLSDIKKAKKSIYIDIPDPVEDNQVANKKIMDALELQKGKGVKVVIRAEDRKNLPQEYIETAIEHTFCMTPVVIIDKKLTWYGMPWSNAKFKVTDQNIPTKYYPIIRFEGKRTAGSIFRILEMNNTTDESKEVMFEGEPTSLAQYVLQNAKCPDCGKPMQLKNNKKGNPYLSCTGFPACTHIDKDVETYAVVYIAKNETLCPKCKSPLEVKQSRYGTYIKCTGIDRHSINLNDL